MNSLKVSHEKFTRNGKEIPHIGSYGGHSWHGFWLKVLDAREAFPLGTELRLARLFEANIGYEPTQQDLYETILQAL